MTDERTEATVEATHSDEGVPTDEEITPPELQRGDEGQWVTALQQDLIRHGYAVEDDGRFGPETVAAVRDFQAVHGLEPDGIAGPNTWTALLRAPGELPTVPDEELAILRAGGMATVDVGAPADETLITLTELLGPPGRDVAIDLAERECVEGSDWADCARAVAEGRILTWDDLGLDVLLTDHDFTSPTAATALHFGGWRLRAGAADRSEATLATTDGLRIGSLLGDVRRVHPGVELYNNEGVYDTFTVYPGGRLAGEFGLTWSELVQHALVARGADIAVDGELGPATLAAWDAFVAAEGLTGETGFPSISVLAALGITFDDVPVTELWSA